MAIKLRLFINLDIFLQKSCLDQKEFSFLKFYNGFLHNFPKFNEGEIYVTTKKKYRARVMNGKKISSSTSR